MITSFALIIIFLLFFFIFGFLIDALLKFLIPSQLTQKSDNPDEFFLFGIIIVCWIVSALSLFIKIGLVAFLLLSGIMLLTLFKYRQKISTLFSTTALNIKNNKIISILTAIFLLFIISKSAYPIANYDSGLYHIQNIKWIENFPAIFGLGNLHNRFAYNSNWFLLSALTGVNYIFGIRFYILNILFTCVSTIFFVMRISKFTRKKTLSGLISLLLFFYSTILTYGYVNSPTQDLPVTLLIWIVIILFIEKYEQSQLHTWDKKSVLILLLCCLAMTIKLSSFPLLMIPAFLFLDSAKKNHHWEWKSLIIGVIFLLPWICRNIMISGCIIYPVAFLQIPWFDWSIPKDTVREMAEIIRAWAILPKMDRDIVLAMPYPEWIIKWSFNRTVEDLVLSIITILGMFLFILQDTYKYIRTKRSGNHDAYFFIFLDVSIFSGALFWFLSAPDPRFGYGYLVAGFIVFISRIFYSILTHNILYKAIALVSICLLSISIVKSFASPNITENFVLPPQVATANTEIQITDDNFSYSIPTDGDQCWDAPLPCAPKTISGLHLRENDFSDGFRIKQ